MATQDKKKTARTSSASPFPSGKTIEVVYFQESSTGTPSSAHRHASFTSAPTATRTSSIPVHWSEADQTSWEVTLRCPNCEWTETEVFDQDTVERFDEELDRGTDQLVDDLKRLVYANMEEQIDRFCDALGNDHVLPEDF